MQNSNLKDCLVFYLATPAWKKKREGSLEECGGEHGGLIREFAINPGQHKGAAAGKQRAQEETFLNLAVLFNVGHAQHGHGI